MLDSKLRFSNRVDNYVRYRPDYPKAIVDDLTRHAKLKDDSVIADIGSGTGKSTWNFLEHGYRCIGVEPNKEMREAAERVLEPFREFQSVEGSAEATGLQKHSINLITAGQAFHWFDQSDTRIEFQRILRPGGHVALIWNERNHTDSNFGIGYEKLLNKYCDDFAQVDYKNVGEDAILAFFSPCEHTTFEYRNSQQFDYAGLEGRLLSSSYCPLPDHQNYMPLMKALNNLFNAHQKNGRVTFDYHTRVYFGQLTNCLES